MDQRFVMSVPKAGEVVGLGRWASYQAAKRNEIPTIKIGNRLFVLVRLYEKMLGLEPGTLTKDDNDANNENDNDDDDHDGGDDDGDDDDEPP